MSGQPNSSTDLSVTCAQQSIARHLETVLGDALRGGSSRMSRAAERSHLGSRAEADVGTRHALPSCWTVRRRLPTPSGGCVTSRVWSEPGEYRFRPARIRPSAALKRRSLRAMRLNPTGSDRQTWPHPPSGAHPSQDQGAGSRGGRCAHCWGQPHLTATFDKDVSFRFDDAGAMVATSAWNVTSGYTRDLRKLLKSRTATGPSGLGHLP